MGVSHGAVVQLQVGAVGALEDAMLEAIHVLLLLLLCVSWQYLLCEADQLSFFRGWAWCRTGGSLSGLSRLTAHGGILQSGSFC